MSYVLLRKLHLALGLFVLPFALLYAVSAFEMAHRFVIRTSETKRSFEVTLEPSRRASTPEGALAALEVAASVRGEIKSASREAGVLVLEIARPGTYYEVRLREGRYASVTEHRSDTLGFLNRMHHAAGLWSPLPEKVLWGALVLVVSAALLLLGITGLLLWLARKAERRAGLLFLATSLAFCVGLLLLIRFA